MNIISQLCLNPAGGVEGLSRETGVVAMTSTASGDLYPWRRPCPVRVARDSWPLTWGSLGVSGGLRAGTYSHWLAVVLTASTFIKMIRILNNLPACKSQGSRHIWWRFSENLQVKQREMVSNIPFYILNLERLTDRINKLWLDVKIGISHPKILKENCIIFMTIVKKKCCLKFLSTINFKSFQLYIKLNLVESAD